MPTFPYVEQTANLVRGNPLGPTALNQLQANIDALDEIQRVEHYAGQHNATEVPWVLGHMDDGAPPTGYLFDNSFGGATLARPATGRYTVNVVSGVITSDASSNLLASVIGNVADSAIEAKPHTITAEYVSATSMQFRVRELSSALSGGNTWADVNRDIDIGVHALQQDAQTSVLSSHIQKQRREFLTEQATDWNALVSNQGRVRKDATLEHTTSGQHNVNRIAKAIAWVRWDGAAYQLDASYRVASVNRPGGSTGVIELVMSDNFSATTTMACFPEVQPSLASELIITNGRGFATGAGTSAFRFYTYAYSGGNWTRVDRSFFVAMFGVIA